MEKTIKIGGKDIRMKSSGSLPRLYRRELSRDLFVDMAEIERAARTEEDGTTQLQVASIELFENLAWIYAKHADPDTPPIDEWLEQFETFDLYEVIPELISMWITENKTTSTLKKKKGRSTGK